MSAERERAAAPKRQNVPSPKRCRMDGGNSLDKGPFCVLVLRLRLAGLWLSQQRNGWAAVRIDVVTVRIGRRPTPELIHLQGVA